MFSTKNIIISVLVSVIVGYAGYIGYSAWKNNVQPVDPLTPELVLSKPKYDIGDQIQATVKHNRQGVKYSVNWAVLDNYAVKNDYTTCGDSCISMGTGSVAKTFLVIADVSYIIDGEIKSYFLISTVVVGVNPNPPNPNPPGPNPPNPNPPNPVIFPDEVYKLSSFTYNEFSKINHQSKVALAQQFAASLDSMSAAIAAGVKKDSETVLKEVNANNNKILATFSVDRSVVVPYFTALQAKLIELDNTVGFERLDNLKKALMEISAGLKAVK